MQFSTNWIKPAQLNRRIAAGRVDQNLVPVDPHVRDDAHVTAGTQKFSSEIYRHSLRTAYRDANVLDLCSPVAVSVLNLQARRDRKSTRLNSSHMSISY